MDTKSGHVSLILHPGGCTEIGATAKWTLSRADAKRTLRGGLGNLLLGPGFSNLPEVLWIV